MNGKCGLCGGVTKSKCRTVLLWLLVLFLTTLFTLLFIMCFIHFLKNNHTPPIVPNDLSDYSTTKSIYFLLSFYFLLWTVVYLGCTVFTVIPRVHQDQEEFRDRSDHPHTEKPGKALLIVLLILLAIITFLLCTIDRIYSPWIMNFVNGKIFSYCVQVSALITLTVALCYIFAILTLELCSTKKAINSGGPTTTNNHPHLTISLMRTPTNEITPLNKSSFANPCYNIEFSLTDSSLLEGGVGQGVTTQV